MLRKQVRQARGQPLHHGQHIFHPHQRFGESVVDAEAWTGLARDDGFALQPQRPVQLQPQPRTEAGCQRGAGEGIERADMAEATLHQACDDIRRQPQGRQRQVAQGRVRPGRWRDGILAVMRQRMRRAHRVGDGGAGVKAEAVHPP